MTVEIATNLSVALGRLKVYETSTSNKTKIERLELVLRRALAEGLLDEQAAPWLLSTVAEYVGKGLKGAYTGAVNWATTPSTESPPMNKDLPPPPPPPVWTESTHPMKTRQSTANQRASQSTSTSMSQRPVTRSTTQFPGQDTPYAKRPFSNTALQTQRGNLRKPPKTAPRNKGNGLIDDKTMQEFVVKSRRTAIMGKQKDDSDSDWEEEDVVSDESSGASGDDGSYEYEYEEYEYEESEEAEESEESEEPRRPITRQSARNKAKAGKSVDAPPDEASGTPVPRRSGRNRKQTGFYSAP